MPLLDSAQRFQTLGLIARSAHPNDKREKHPLLTEEGKLTTQTAQTHAKAVDADFAEVVGADGVETLRQTLQILLQRARANNKRDGFKPLA